MGEGIFPEGFSEWAQGLGCSPTLQGSPFQPHLARSNSSFFILETNIHCLHGVRHSAGHERGARYEIPGAHGGLNQCSCIADPCSLSRLKGKHRAQGRVGLGPILGLYFLPSEPQASPPTSQRLRC